LRIISFYSDEKALIRKAIAGDHLAQKQLFERHAPKMLSVCRQYIGDLHFAEDIMIRGFVKVFGKLHTFRFEGSFEGWIRRIMVREAITSLRQKQFVVFDEESTSFETASPAYMDSELQAEYIQSLIDQLPEGYKMVFVLHVVEGYKHAEIAKLLGISESTSRTQLFKARNLLQEQLKQYKNQGYGTN
jgi:RNA polymerase sigma-70 factor (ECF subfamily)